ncbi:tetratricopeptide repeat-containing sensor histidine kinase [Pseudoalteromonas rubra]|uniref:Histidine kinase domain-containing protein n=1 Tax=Pseudoalteromonas rubra TaxID=43658 RepID=A0A5S3X6N2_9GAMM|nr:tetratricopeptide repeat-containing sensor histidine kinase [Pseudoalteromonas rubra]TMP39718.1 hypothetical protein CWB98_03780 [Pseudoalteromonas rubra]
MSFRSAMWMLVLVSGIVLATPYTEAEFEQLRAQIRTTSIKSPLKAISLTDDMLIKHGDKLSTRQKIRLLYGKAWFQIQTDDIEAAIVTLSGCKRMSKEISDPTILFSYYSLTAGALTRMSMYERALENYLESYRIAGLMDTELFLRQTENNIGNVYLKLGRYEDAKVYFERFYEDAKERALPQQMGVGLNNLGEVYFGLKDYQKALLFHKDSLSLREENELTYHSSWSHHNLGKTYLALGNSELAEQHLVSAVALRKQSNAVADSIAPQIELIRLKLQQQGNRELEPLIHEAISLSSQYDRFQEKVEAHQLLVDYYNQMQDWKNALNASDLYMQSKFDFLQRQAETGVAFYAAQMNLAMKERDIAKLTQENTLYQLNTQAARNQLILVLVSASIIVCLSLYFMRRIRAKNHALTETLDNLKTTQKQLLESEKMSAMTTLVSGMAHQLNTPLGLVVTSASCLEDKLKDISTLLSDQKLSAKQLQGFLEDASEMLSMTAKNASRAADLIARFKMVAASLDTSDVMHFDVLDYLTQRGALIGQSLDQSIKLDVYGAPCQVMSYPEALLKVISQLVNNSCAHGFVDQPFGKITIEVKDEGEYAIVVYEDNGVGISDVDQQQMFDPFYTSQLGQGKLGLGLNIAYNSVVQVLKGSIQYEHKAHGARFVIQFPKNLP